MSALPFEIPSVSRGFAEVSSAARAAATRAADAVAKALSRELGCDVKIAGRPLPGRPAAGAGCARLSFELAALPGVATLEVEAQLVARLVDRLAGGNGDVRGVLSLTPIEFGALELFGLVAVDALRSDADVEALLAPRLCRGGRAGDDAAAVDLALRAGDLEGRARLFLPGPAVAVFRSAPRLADSVAAAVIELSLRHGGATVSEEELGAFAPGDVLLLDDAPRHALCLAAGPRLLGRLEDAAFHVEEIAMTEQTAQFPITLEVELARVPVTLADLARLEPGAALALAIPRRGAVTLRVGDRAVAQGELVDIDGAVGVRITKLGE